MLFLVAVIGTTAALAQEATPISTQEMKPVHMKMNGDGVTMENGKMMVVKGGKMSAMDKEVTLTNGSVVTTDGTIKLQDGTSKKLKNGDCVYMDGKIEPMVKKGTMLKKVP